MYKSFVPPYRTESRFNRQILQIPAHLSVTDYDVVSGSLYVLTVTDTTDPSVVYEVSVSATDDEWCAVQVSQLLKFPKTLLLDTKGTVTLTSVFFRGEVGGD